jgi:signal transduction histidine kinase
MSLRWRLTLYYSALSALIVVLGGVAFFVVLRQNLQTTLDTSLREATELAASQLGEEPQFGDGQSEGFTKAQTDELLEHLAGSGTLVIFNAQKQELDQVGQLRLTAPLIEGFSNVTNHRVYTLRLDNGNWVQAMRSQVETLQAIGQAQRLLLVGLPFLLLIGFGVGYFLADGALKPVDRVTGLAERITHSGHFHERVPELSGNDEMARLTSTFNNMLARLESTLEREKAFALAAAHELRTPLAFMQGRASLSLEKPRSPEQYQSALGQIYSSSVQMTQMVEALLALARSNQAPRRDSIDLAKVLNDVAKTYQDEAHQRSVKLELQSDEARLHGDETALRLVLGNLLHNAIKYGHQGGHILLKSGRQSHEVFLAVCDDGPGIPDADLERLRQPFQRGAGLQGVSGSGLGLALASAVAEQHGGRLELTRAVQGGLRATLWLPKQ